MDTKHKNRKFKINEEYFDVLDTEGKLYFLGLLSADGYINNKYNSVELSLNNDDRDILEKLKNEIYPDKNYTLAEYHYKNTVIIAGREASRKPTVRLVFRSKKIVAKLNEYGLFQKKSFSIKWPKIELNDNLLKHYIRGLIDGDGCLSKFEKSKSFCVNFIGSLNFCESLQETVKKFGFHFKLKKIEYSQTMGTLWLFGRRKCESFLDWLYDGASFYLERKYLNYKNLKKDIMDTYGNLKRGSKGYTYLPKEDRYLVRIRKNGKYFLYKRFKTKEEAIRAHEEKRKELYLSGIL